MAKTVHTDGDPAQAIQGSRVLAAYLNALNNHRHEGKDEDGSGVLDYAVDTGAANVYAIALDPALTAHVEGMPIFFRAANANTGASTININGLGAVALTKTGATALSAGDIQAGQVCVVIYDGTRYQLVGNMIAPGDGLEISGGTLRVKLDGATLTRGAAGMKVSPFTQAFTSTNGYVCLPGGVLIQWGFVVLTAENHATVTFPLTFPTAMRAAFGSCWYTYAEERTAANCAANVYPVSASQVVIIADAMASGSMPIEGVFWWAIGN